jgi:hypothetical protein
MMGLLVTVLFFTAIIGTIASSVGNPDGNITGGALVLYGLITLIVVAGFITYLYNNSFKGR